VEVGGGRGVEVRFGGIVGRGVAGDGGIGGWGWYWGGGGRGRRTGGVVGVKQGSAKGR